MRTVLEREWVRVVGHRDVPGRPALYATTKQFLDYFGLQSLDALPSLAELKDVDDLNQDLFGQSSVGSENESEGGTVISDKEQMDTETSEVAQVVAAASEADSNEPGADSQTSALHQTDPTHTES
jgi:segregation and condensation protein B